MEKQWYQSKTIWLNLISLLLAILALAQQTFGINPAVIAFIVGVGNLVLRFVDGQPIVVGNKTFGKKS